MGNKDSKVDVNQFLKISDVESTTSRDRSDSGQALADCLASLSDMAQTGMDTKLPCLPPGCADLVDGDMSPDTFRKVHGQLRRHLEKRLPGSKSARKQMELLDNMILEQDEDPDWASMRSWMVWCIHTNLDDDEKEAAAEAQRSETQRAGSSMSSASSSYVARRRLSRQKSTDGQRRLKHQDSFDSVRGVSAQSSLESNAET